MPERDEPATLGLVATGPPGPPARPVPARRVDRELLLRVAGSVAGGLALVLSFPPYDLVWLAPPALAAMTLSWHGVRARRGFWLGTLAGFAFLAWHIAWLRVVGDDAWLLTAGAFSLFVGLVGAGVAATSRLRVWPLAVPLMWVLSEAVRGRAPLGGFPWGDLAFGQTSTTLTPYAALAGAPGVTFAVALVGALLAFAWTARRRPRATVAALVGVAVVCTAGALVPLPVDGETGPAGEPASVTAAVVQGGVPSEGLDAFGQRAAVLTNHVTETERLAADVAAGVVPRPELVVWPENSTDIDPFVDDWARARIQEAVDAVGVPVLVGAVVNDPADPTRVRNTGIVWLPSSSGTPGPSSFYVKQHPVPFGEWIPLRPLLSRLISRFDLVPRDFEAGTSTGVLQLGPARIGDLICFEVAYNGLGRAAVRGDGVQGELAGQGARLITVQTNNATYEGTGQPEQQLAMSRLRAVEHGRAVLVAATSGITAIVLPDGSLAGSVGEHRAGYLVATVPLRDTLTVADRVGAVPELLACAAAVWLLVLVALRARRERGTALAAGPADVGSGVRPRAEEAP
ncbi:MAG: apolipoprotein N-acyltransferase [Frankiales bacterium]|nr:apolipoprotein N-acyltransferase [Frankiales bacterium]